MTLIEFVEYIKERASNMEEAYCKPGKCKLYRRCDPDDGGALCADIMDTLETMEVQLDSR